MTLIPLPDAKLYFEPEFFAASLAAIYFNELLNSTEWHQQHISCFGKRVPVPRLTAWKAEDDLTYSYSGISLPPHQISNSLHTIKEQLEERFQLRFNSVLLNRYRDGNDSVSWHADDENVLGEEPDIASVSLGATRRFQMKHRRFANEKLTLDLSHGSVLLMRGRTQKNWLHRVPKTRKAVGERINLTFRFVHR